MNITYSYIDIEHTVPTSRAFKGWYAGDLLTVQEQT